MQRIEDLILKLKEQYEAQADNSQLLNTVQQLHNELLTAAKPAPPKVLGTSKVSVVMPANVSMETYQQYAPRVEQPVAQEKVETVLVDEGTLSIVQENGQLDMVFDPLSEIPTLAQQLGEPAKSKNGESLNDKLKQGKTELLEFLKESPVKDLRKAIGINDRFSFISELFRGDEAMYERSVKTINGFNIYPEAEYWIIRELKTKLGWNPEHEMVLHFDHLVRRRFS